MQLPLLPPLPVLPPLPPLPVFPQFSPWYPLDRAPWQAGFYEVRDDDGVIFDVRPRWMPSKVVMREIVFKGEATPMGTVSKPGYWLHMPAGAVAWRGLSRPAA